jgi:hypothetical protein
MYTTLGFFAAVLGLIIISGAIYTIGSIIKQSKKLQNGQSLSKLAGRYFLRWSLFDYAVLVIFLSGMLFLLTEVIAVLRDRTSFPYYHYGYLLCGFTFSLIGMLFVMVRLVLVLRMVRDTDSSSLVNDHQKPKEANTAE